MAIDPYCDAFNDVYYDISLFLNSLISNLSLYKGWITIKKHMFLLYIEQIKKKIIPFAGHYYIIKILGLLKR